MKMPNNAFLQCRLTWHVSASVDWCLRVDFEMLIGVCDIPSFGSPLAENSKIALLHSENTGVLSFLMHAKKWRLS